MPMYIYPPEFALTGAVDSVNGQQGVVVLDAGDVGAATEAYVDAAVAAAAAVTIAKVDVPGFTASGGNEQLPFTDSDAVTGSDLALIGTNLFTAPTTGWYQVNANMQLNRDTGAAVLLYYQINAGSQVLFVGEGTGAGVYPRPNGTVSLYLTAADTVKLHVTSVGSGGDTGAAFTATFLKL